MNYIWRVLLALDDFVGAALPGGKLDCTISTRCYEQRAALPWRWLYRALNWLSPDHCERAHKYDQMRAAVIERYLDN